MKAVVAAFKQEKALVGAFSVITNLRMELFEALQQELREQFGQRAALFLALDVREEENWRQVTTSSPVTAHAH